MTRTVRRNRFTESTRIVISAVMTMIFMNSTQYTVALSTCSEKKSDTPLCTRNSSTSTSWRLKRMRWMAGSAEISRNAPIVSESRMP